MTNRWILLVALGSAACGSSSVSVDDFADKYIDAYCEHQVACEYAKSVAECKASANIKTHEFLTLIDGAKKGVIDYNADAAGECIDDVRNASCVFDGFQQTSACADVASGTVAEGGDCFIDDQCAGHGQCVPTDANCHPSDSCCPGTCGPASKDVASGGSCSNNDRCADGTYCKPPAAGSDLGTCTALVATEGAACDSFYACADPLVCNVFADAPTCERPAKSGAMCMPDAFLACADIRQHCDLTTQKCVDALAAGAMCQSSSECLNSASCAGGTCQDKLAMGAACSSTSAACQGDLECLNNTCQLPAASMSCL